MKKLMSVFLVLSMILVMVVGCSSDNSESKSKSESEGVKVSGEIIETSEEPVTLHIIHWNTLDQSVIDKFEKENPGIKIQFEKFLVDKFIQVMKTRIAANELPDIMGAQEVDFKDYVKRGEYMDLTDEQFLDNYYEEAKNELKAFSGDGRVYSVPTLSWGLGIWINKDLFEDNGISVPTNWDELVEASKQFKEKGIAPFVQGIKDGWPIQQDMLPMFALQVESPDYYEKMKTGEHKWTDEPVMAAFQKWADLFAEEGMLIKGSMGLTYEQAYQVFEQGKVAMWPMGSWATEFMQDKEGNIKELPFNVDFIPAPYNEAGEETVLAATYIGSMYAISAKTKHPEEAKKFIEFLTKPENATEYAKGNGALFPVKGVDFSEVVPYGEKVSETVFGGKILMPFNTAVDAAIEKQLTVALQNLVAGNAVEGELKEMQKVQETANRERK